MSVTLWPWRRPIHPPHFLITKPKHIKKTQSHSATKPNTATISKRKQCLQRPFTELTGRNKAQHLHTWFSARAHRTSPDPNSPNTPSLFLTAKLWGLQQLPWSPLSKCDWTGFLLLIVSSHRSENPFAWLCFRPGYTLWLKGQKQLFQSTSLRPQLQHSTRHNISVTVLQLDWKLYSQWARGNSCLDF